MFGKKKDLPKPVMADETPKEEIKIYQQQKRQELESLKKKLEAQFEKLEAEEQLEKVKEVPPPPPPNQTIDTNIEASHVLEAVKELYGIMSQRFDQIYYKIDQTQDMILKDKK